MVTEAAGTGKPVYVQVLKGGSRQLARFHALMQERGATRPFEGRLETWRTRRSTTPNWSPPPLGTRYTLKPKPNSWARQAVLTRVLHASAAALTSCQPSSSKRQPWPRATPR